MVESPAIRHEKLVHMILNRYYKRSFWALERHGITYDDLVQEGLYAILRAEPEFDPDRFNESTFYAAAVKNWIGSRVCVKNMAFKKRRLNGETISLDSCTNVHDQKHNDGPLLGGTMRTKDGLDDAAILESIVLKQALEHLRFRSERQYAAVCMRFYDDFDNIQIAAALKCSTQNASWLILQGLAFLRGLYKTREGGQSA